VPQSRSGTATRPTTDRVRESLFNVLAAQQDFDGLAVLDLYAGSGALGLEAISRGASSALFVESDRRASAVISDNVTSLGAHGTRVRCAPVAVVVAGPSAGPFDVVFADPPYDLPTADVEAVLAALTADGWLRPGAIAVVERSTMGPELSWPTPWSVRQVRRYGDTRLEIGEIA
jgi:16S rRNA (guanine966-N2)-methyltransferase